MDGEAVCQALGTVCGPDCLKDVIPKYGIRLKVYNAVKTAVHNDESYQEVQF